MLRNGIHSRISLGEETITDINLLEIQIRHPNEVRTAKFSKRKEGQVTGADWEWWLGSKSGWIGLRIQAKKLNSHSLVYESLDNPRGQVDILIRNANSNGLTALYCFYNYWNTQHLTTPWNCGTFPPSPELNGCTITSASTVKNLISAGDKSLKSVSQNAMPWNCLICCTGHSNPRADLVERATGFLQARWAINDEQLVTRKQPPEYVNALLNNELPDLISETVSHVLVLTEGLMS